MRRAGDPLAYASAATAALPDDRWFAQWSSAAANLQRIQRGAVCAPADADARFADALTAAQVVSFDVFDTLVTRACASPSDVFRFLSLEAPFSALEFTAAEIAAHRRAAETEARRTRANRTGTDAEVTLLEIHGVLARRLGFDDAAALAAAELAVERRLLRVNPRVVPWFAAARAAGRRVLVISDTWYSAAHLHGLLAHVGIDLPLGEIFTSADARATKQDGRLFDRVQPHVAVPTTEWLHVGDHPVSDDQTPRTRGICTLLQPFDGARSAPAPEATLAGSVRIGLTTAARHHPAEMAWRIGYRTLGPLLTGFAHWIGAQARVSGAKRVVFLLRDGLIFERICRVANTLPEHVSVSALPASRRAALLPATLSDARWALPGLLAGVGPRPIGEYLSRLGLQPAQHAAALARAGAPDLSLPVDARRTTDGERILRLLAIPEISRALGERATVERDALLHALSAAGLRSGSPSMLVDLGWNGTIQKALHRVVAAADGHDPAWIGRYLATWPGITEGAPSGMSASGFLCHAGQSSTLMRSLATGRELLEVLCSSFDGSLLHFTGTAGAPVLAPYEFDAAHARTIRSIHDGAAAYAVDHSAVLDAAEASLSVAEAVHEWTRLTHTPTHDEACLLGRLAHSDNVGSQSSRRLASFTTSHGDSNGLLQDWALAYWKEGLTAQRTREGAALRSILWLADESAV